MHTPSSRIDYPKTVAFSNKCMWFLKWVHEDYVKILAVLKFDIYVKGVKSFVFP